MVLPAGPQPILGIFVHHGNHYTAMIRRDNILYHIDSLPAASGAGRYVYIVSPELFVAYATFYARGLRIAQREVGGLYSVYYDGRDLLAPH